MANIRLKRSSVASKVPLVGDLDLGEMAINTNDGKVFIKKDDGTASIVEVGGGNSEHYDQEATPTPSVTGATWYVPSTSKTYLYVNDGTSDYWIDISGVGPGETLPDQSGHSGDILSTNGSDAIWVAASQNEYYNQDATPTAVNLGAIWYKPSTSYTYLWVNDGSNNLWLQQ